MGRKSCKKKKSNDKVRIELLRRVSGSYLAVYLGRISPCIWVVSRRALLSDTQV